VGFYQMSSAWEKEMVGGIEMIEHLNLGRGVIGHDDISWVIDHLP
jgi:hypothetical protein